MENGLTDADFQRKLSIKSFLDSNGWKMFETTTKERLEVVECKINEITKESVSDEKVQELNFCLGKKRAFQEILGIKQEMEEELEDVKSPQRA